MIKQRNALILKFRENLNSFFNKKLIAKSVIFLGLICLVLEACQYNGTRKPASEPLKDMRETAHGIRFVPQKGSSNYWLVWSKSLKPLSQMNKGGSWDHDIYYSEIITQNPRIEPRLLIQQPEAQEPANAAVSTDGHIFVTYEDGFDTEYDVAQRFMVYDQSLKRDKEREPEMVEDGGHSGHVAAVGNRFVVFYSDGWVTGGGVDQLGSGQDVMVKVYSSSGQFESYYPVAVGKDNRDWWPLLAGSSKRAFLLWQRFIPNRTKAQLMYGVFDPETGAMVGPIQPLVPEVNYYTYDVQYIASVDRFLVTGTDSESKGFAILLDKDGTKMASLNGLPSTVREAHPAVFEESNKAKVVLPIDSGGVLVFNVTPTDIRMNAQLENIHKWNSIGTDGIFLDGKIAYFATLGSNGVEEVRVEIPE